MARHKFRGVAAAPTFGAHLVKIDRFLALMLQYSYAGEALAIGGHGGTGRRAGFRIQCRKAWRFDPSCPHQ